MKKRALSLLLSVILAAGLIPGTASAWSLALPGGVVPGGGMPRPAAASGGAFHGGEAEPGTSPAGACENAAKAVRSLFVDGLDLTQGGYFAADGTRAAPGEDYAYHYDPATQTLTIQNAVITRPGGPDTQAGIFADGDLTLVLSGRSEIAGSALQAGVYVDGSLTVQSAGEGALAIRAQCGVHTAGGFYMTGGQMDIASENAGVWAEGGAAIRGGRLDITAQSGCGMNLNSGMTISGGEITMDAATEGLSTSEGDVTITGGKITVMNAMTGLNAQLGGVAVFGGEIAIQARVSGIYCDNDAAMRGGTLAITAGSYGIQTAGGIIASGGTIRLFSGSFGLDAVGTIAISGGELAVNAFYGICSATELRVCGGRVTVTGEWGLVTIGCGEFRGGAIRVEAEYGVCTSGSEGPLFSGSAVTIIAGKRGVCAESALSDFSITGGRLAIEPAAHYSKEDYFPIFSRSPIRVQDDMQITAGGQVKTVEIDDAVYYTIGSEAGTISPRVVIERPLPPEAPEPPAPQTPDPIQPPAPVQPTTPAPALPPERTIAVAETSSALFRDAAGPILVETDMEDAFTRSVEVRVTDTQEDAFRFGLGLVDKVYPFDISLYIKGTDEPASHAPGFAVTVYLPVPDSLLDVMERLAVLHKSESGAVAELPSRLMQKNGAWYIVFEASAFSPFALLVRYTRPYDESAGVPCYTGPDGGRVFIGLAARGRYVAPLGAVVSVAQNGKSFSDTAGHWAEESIAFVTERELFLGTGGGAFSPGAGMTRAMLVTVIGRLYERSYGEIAPAPGVFSDCDASAYYATYAAWAFEKGLVTGLGGGLFGPEDLITREQMAAMLYRFADLLGVLPDGLDPALNYPDAGSISNWAKTAALYCQTAGLMVGRDGGAFAPRETVTRAEAAAVLQRFTESILG